MVLGEIQPTALPEEAIKHTDSVVIGEDEGCWEKAILASEWKENSMERYSRICYQRMPL